MDREGGGRGAGGAVGCDQEVRTCAACARAGSRPNGKPETDTSKHKLVPPNFIITDLRDDGGGAAYRT